MDRPEGVAVIGEKWSGDIQEHGYWGGMRDRFPLSQTDPMLGGGPPEIHRDGDRVRVYPRPGSVPDPVGPGHGRHRGRYVDDVEPTLRAGMEFFRDEGRPIGCYANRYPRIMENGAPVDKSFGTSWWRSLDALERWSESHPTHVAPFGAAMRCLTRIGPSARLRFYHEVSVVAPDEQYSEYLGCHESTGLLRADQPVGSR